MTSLDFYKMSVKKRVSLRQLTVLAEFLENHVQLVRGFGRSTEGRHNSRLQWEALAKQLNSIKDGCPKTPKEWNKVSL